MTRTFRTLSLPAILTALLLLAGCATKGKSVVLLDGRHVKAWSKAEAAAVPALAAQADMAKAWVYVATDTGMEIMYGLDVSPPKDKK